MSLLQTAKAETNKRPACEPSASALGMLFGACGQYEHFCCSAIVTVSRPPPCHKVRAQRNLPPRLLVQAAMASSSSSGQAPWPKWPPSPASRQHPGAHGWLLRQAERLQAVREASLAREVPPPGVHFKAGAPPPPPRADHRTVEGLRCAGFLPGRKVRYVLGRAVCVAGLIQSAFQLCAKREGCCCEPSASQRPYRAQVCLNLTAARCSC